MDAEHVSQSAIERYYCGRIKGPDLAVIERHLPFCQQCLKRLAEAQQFVHLLVEGVIAERGNGPNVWF